jgi:triacylglycerol lipase
MLALLQRSITVSLLASATVWAIYFISTGRPVWAWVGALCILLGYAGFLAVEFVMLSFVQKGDPAPPASPRQLLMAWWGEVITAPRVFCWRQPFRSNAEPDHVPPAANGTRGVVLVHGFFCNRALWNPWMSKLRAAQVPFIAVNLQPVFGSIDDYAGIVNAAVQRMASTTGMPPVVVAHSMGGLAVRAWLAKACDDTRVHRVITIGSPHHGTWLARFGHTRNGKQMRLDNDWLKSLERTETPERLAKFTCFYSHCDNIVFPPSTATLQHSVSRHVAGTAHVHLVFQGDAYQELLRWVSPRDPSSGQQAKRGDPFPVTTDPPYPPADETRIPAPAACWSA